MYCRGKYQKVSLLIKFEFSLKMLNILEQIGLSDFTKYEDKIRLIQE